MNLESYPHAFTSIEFPNPVDSGKILETLRDEVKDSAGKNVAIHPSMFRMADPESYRNPRVKEVVLSWLEGGARISEETRRQLEAIGAIFHDIDTAA